MPRSRWTILVVFAIWTLFVWATRIDNIWADEALTSGGKIARTVLALSFVAAAAGLATVSVRTFRGPPGPLDARIVEVVAVWTVGVWVVRSVGIALGDHGGAFIVVHLGLGLVSSALALGSVWAVRHARRDAPRPVDVTTT